MRAIIHLINFFENEEEEEKASFNLTQTGSRDLDVCAFNSDETRFIPRFIPQDVHYERGSVFFVVEDDVRNGQ